jgi:NAD(P)-dependent dehydrogenase (short-subunit alcohol dehydrogenase family)
MTEKPAVLVLGASRGLGLGLAQEWCRRGWRVIATKRSASPQLEELASQYPDSLEIETADIADAGSVRALGTRLAGRRLDVLFVNAGIGQSDGSTPAAVDEAEFARLMLTNALAPVRAIEILEALVPAGGVIAAMSSQLASIANNSGFWEFYSASKAALNMLMKCFAGRRAGDPRAMLLVSPGWVRTDMGGPDASLSVEESAAAIVQMVEESRGKPGLRFVDRFGQGVPW